MSFRTLGLSLVLLSVLLPGMSALAVEENTSRTDAFKHCASSELGDSLEQQVLENIQIAQGDGVVQTTPAQKGQPARSHGEKPIINEPLSAGCGSCQFGNDTGKIVWGICIPCN